MRIGQIIVAAMFGCVLAGAIGAETAEDTGHMIDQALAGEHRAPGNATRDAYRHPKETLLFLGLEPGMTVVEIWPAMGWYAEVLAPVLRPGGVFFAAGFSMTADRTPGWRKEMQTEFREKMESHPDVYDRVIATGLSVPERTTIAPPGSADLVLTFRNVHNWMKGDYAEEMFGVFYRTLKPSGILGIVEHRAKPGTSLDDMKRSGYVTEAHVIELAERAGFALEARSDINANPSDKKNHPAGVWTLPPSLRHCKSMGQGVERDACFETYRRIGESDRMTLRFRKPS